MKHAGTNGEDRLVCYGKLEQLIDQENSSSACIQETLQRITLLGRCEDDTRADLIQDQLIPCRWTFKIKWHVSTS